MERDETMRNALSRKFYMELIPPGSGDAVADLDRLLSALKKSFGDVVISQSTFRRDYMLLRDFDWKLTVTMIPKGHEWEIVRIQRGDTTDKNFGYAVDLGSTTVVMQLVDLNTGNSLGQESVFNAQIPYGSEILSRIFYVKDHPERLKELQACTLANIRQLMDALERKTGVLREDCSVMAVAGNTTMVHFLLGYDPWFIFHAPYAPAFGSCGFIPSQDLDLPFPGLVTCLPSVANYVGGDVVSGLLASGLYQSEEISLYMDIGTNGEMVLGNKDFLLSAAGAAGPALEGGISRQGMPARSGAVDSVRILNRTLSITTIDHAKPIGICGSGIVDLLSEMLLEGWIDMSGAFVPGKSERIVLREDGYAVVYALPGESGSGEELLFTQRDIAGYLDTKAAANTMVAYLLEASGVKAEELSRVYLAGAFGTYLNLESAITIGLYPDLPRDRFVILGNGSLKGAQSLLLNFELLETAERIAERMDDLSLGEAPDFLTKMIAARFLPHTDLRQYPSVAEKIRKRKALSLLPLPEAKEEAL